MDNEIEYYSGNTGENLFDMFDKNDEAVLNGDYDLTDELEEVMNANDDMEEDNELLDESALLIQTIIDNCEGVDENGNPRAAFMMILDDVNPDSGVTKRLASFSCYRPIMSFYNRCEFVELVFDFATSVNSEMRVIWKHVQQYGQLLDAINKNSISAPHLCLLIVPLSGYGCYYIFAENPIFWALQSANPGGPQTQLKLCYRAEDINFYQTDEMNMTEIEASAQRARHEALKNRDNAVEAQERKEELLQKRNKQIEEQRRKSI